MWVGDLFKRQKPRGLTWTPRYYNPEDDEQYDEMRRQTRIEFSRLRTSSSRKRGINPFILLAFIVMIGSVIFIALREKPVDNVPEVQLQAEDALQPSQTTRGHTLSIERDTVRVEANADNGTSEVAE
jgi:hypothetical protein